MRTWLAVGLGGALGSLARHGVNALVQNLTFALYRDFPDPVRQRGQEKF